MAIRFSLPNSEPVTYISFFFVLSDGEQDDDDEGSGRAGDRVRDIVHQRKVVRLSKICPNFTTLVGGDIWLSQSCSW